MEGESSSQPSALQAENEDLKQGIERKDYEALQAENEDLKQRIQRKDDEALQAAIVNELRFANELRAYVRQRRNAEITQVFLDDMPHHVRAWLEADVVGTGVSKAPRII